MYIKDFILQAKSPVNFMDFQKYTRHPLRHIVSSSGAVTYGVAMDLQNIFKLLVGHCPHHIRNTYTL